VHPLGAFYFVCLGRRDPLMHAGLTVAGKDDRSIQKKELQQLQTFKKDL
jgi:hypothetical protein